MSEAKRKDLERSPEPVVSSPVSFYAEQSVYRNILGENWEGASSYREKPAGN